MKEDKSPAILTINGGSSSIKFAVYLIEQSLQLFLSGHVKGIGTKHSSFNFAIGDDSGTETVPVDGADIRSIAQEIINLLDTKLDGHPLIAVGHRIVHGMQHAQPELISDELMDELNKISPYDPGHLPGEIELVKIFRTKYYALKHVACFDTSFHTTMPQVAKWIALPRRFFAKGIQRYGFHGLSYAFLMDELKRIAGKDIAESKIILAHLGNGASLAAVKGGKSMDTSMGFTPAAGIPMSTRSGDLDPGVMWYLVKNERIEPEQFNHIINHESGLLGISETSSDMRELLEKEHTDQAAAEAIELFCYQTRKWIGAMAAALGGVDTLIFSGGIGEQASLIRERICSGLEFIGITIDKEKNKDNKAIISLSTGHVQVRVMKTNEELMMARLVKQLIGSN